MEKSVGPALARVGVAPALEENFRGSLASEVWSSRVQTGNRASASVFEGAWLRESSAVRSVARPEALFQSRSVSARAVVGLAYDESCIASSAITRLP